MTGWSRRGSPPGMTVPRWCRSTARTTGPEPASSHQARQAATNGFHPIDRIRHRRNSRARPPGTRIARMTRNRQITALMASAALLSAVPFVLQPRAAFGQSDAVAVAPPGKTVDARVWPRSYKVDGVEFALYQPQVDSWEGNEIKARQVMAVTTGQDRKSTRLNSSH